MPIKVERGLHPTRAARSDPPWRTQESHYTWRTSSLLVLHPTTSSQLPWHTNLKELKARFSQKVLMMERSRTNLHMDGQVAVTGESRGKSPLETWDFRTKPGVGEDP